MDQADVPALLSRLESDEDASRKMAVFKLQSSINDPAFADVFITSGGLVVLRRLIMSSSGNTLAYSLQSLTRLLEVDMGWEVFEGPSSGELVERVVELIVTNPLVNILRGAMSILGALVGHTQSMRSTATFGFRALKPAVAVYPQFFELVLQQLASADHALCANALMLINSLIRDALQNEENEKGEEWARLVKRLQDLGLVKTVYNLMQSSALQDLALPMMDFQSLTKVMLRKWKNVKVNLERPEHRRTLKILHLASTPGQANPSVNGHTEEDVAEIGRMASRRHNPEKWRRLGFETESPAQDFEGTGYLGMMDLFDYAKKNEEGFQKLLLEQLSKPAHARCPVARSSLAVTKILYDLFDIDKTDISTAKGYQGNEVIDIDTMFKPLILHWSRLHTTALRGFFRLWRATGAEHDDFDRVRDLARILIGKVIGQATRTKDISEVEEEMQEIDVARLRELQMQVLETAFEESWGHHLEHVRDGLKHEALQFVREQRVRCILEGSWFMRPQSRRDHTPGSRPGNWRFVRLSPNRRFLHHRDFEQQVFPDPAMESLHDKVDLGVISSVVSNVSVPGDDARSVSSNMGQNQNQNQSQNKSQNPAGTTTKITIYSLTHPGTPDPDECPILTLWPSTQSLASEWLDGLLMLLNQAPITAETAKLVNLVSDHGLRIRLLNVRMDSALDRTPQKAGVVPSRDALDEDYFFEI